MADLSKKLPGRSWLINLDVLEVYWLASQLDQIAEQTDILGLAIGGSDAKARDALSTQAGCVADMISSLRNKTCGRGDLQKRYERHRRREAQRRSAPVERPALKLVPNPSG